MNSSPPDSSSSPTPEVPTSGTAMASLVLGLLSVVGLIITGIPAVICGHLGLKSVRNSGGHLRGRGLALTGLTLGYLAMVATIVGGWFLYGKMQRDQRLESARKAGQQLHAAMRAYAATHNQNLPARLTELVDIRLVTLAYLTNPPEYPAEFWEYYGQGHSTEDAGKTIVLTSKPLGDTRIVVRLGGAIQIVKNSDWEVQTKGRQE